MTPASSQNSKTELAQATLAVKREKKLMDVVSMYREKLKEAGVGLASNEVSQKQFGKQYQENVSFVAFFEVMDALTKNSVALIQTQYLIIISNYMSTFTCYFLCIKFLPIIVLMLR